MEKPNIQKEIKRLWHAIEDLFSQNNYDSVEDKQEYLNEFLLDDFKLQVLSSITLPELKKVLKKLLKVSKALREEEAAALFSNNIDQVRKRVISDKIHWLYIISSFESIKASRFDAVIEYHSDLDMIEFINSEVQWAEYELKQISFDPSLQPASMQYKKVNKTRAALKRYLKFLNRRLQDEENNLKQSDHQEVDFIKSSQVKSPFIASNSIQFKIDPKVVEDLYECLCPFIYKFDHATLFRVLKGEIVNNNEKVRVIGTAKQIVSSFGFLFENNFIHTPKSILFQWLHDNFIYKEKEEGKAPWITESTLKRYLAEQNIKPPFPCLKSISDKYK